MSLVSDIDAFYFEHRSCGDLEGEVWQEGRNIRVWMSCGCGAMFNRVILMKKNGPATLR